MTTPVRPHAAGLGVTGVVPAILTPFRDGRLAEDMFALHLAWLADRGVGCVAPLGTTGEGLSLSVPERKTMIDAVADFGMEFIAGTGCTNLPETIELAAYAMRRGAQALLIGPPSYYEPQDLGAWYGAVCESLPAEGRVLLYHIPARSPAIPDELLHDLSSHYGPMIAGVKDSSNDLGHTLRWLSLFPQITIASGTDATALEFGAAGGQLVISAIANVVPLEVQAAFAGDASAQCFVKGVRSLAMSFPREAALKALLQLASGIPMVEVRPPLAQLSEEQAEGLARAFGGLTAANGSASG